jgi:ribulose-5-phosphate 4-epimerase/fuculose-1-phosphate aldolase
MATSDIDFVKREVAIANRILSETGLATGVTASLGHVSMRVPSNPDKFVVKGRGYDIDVVKVMRAQDMIVCDLEGYKIDGPPKSTQCSEVKIHSCIYKLRPDVQSVVHVHPRYTVLMSVLQKTLVPMCQEGSQFVRTPLPVHPRARTVWSNEDGMELAEGLGDGRAILMIGHGATMTGDSLEQSVLGMVQLEEQARMNYLAYCAEGPNHGQVADELLQEGIDRPRQDEYPHFTGLMRQIGGNPKRDGPWNYYRSLVSDGV